VLQTNSCFQDVHQPKWTSGMCPHKTTLWWCIGDKKKNLLQSKRGMEKENRAIWVQCGYNGSHRVKPLILLGPIICELIFSEPERSIGTYHGLGQRSREHYGPLRGLGLQQSQFRSGSSSDSGPSKSGSTIIILDCYTSLYSNHHRRRCNLSIQNSRSRV
jgi:hypothetical protein